MSSSFSIWILLSPHFVLALTLLMAGLWTWQQKSHDRIRRLTLAAIGCQIAGFLLVIAVPIVVPGTNLAVHMTTIVAFCLLSAASVLLFLRAAFVDRGPKAVPDANRSFTSPDDPTNPYAAPR